MMPLLMVLGEFVGVVFWCMLFHRRGFKRGYKSGYQCGRIDSEKWFIAQGAEVEEMRKRIWKEEERRP